MCRDGIIEMDRLVFHEDYKLICWFPIGELTSEIIVNYYLAMKACPVKQTTASRPPPRAGR